MPSLRFAGRLDGDRDGFGVGGFDLVSDRDQLELLKRIADTDDRSLASLVRHCCKYWLQSAEGRELSRRAKDLMKTNIIASESEEPKS